MERSRGWHGMLLAEHPARRCGLARLFFPLPFQTPCLALLPKQEPFSVALLPHLRVHNPILHRIEQQTSSIFCLHLKANAAMLCNFNLDINHKKSLQVRESLMRQILAVHFDVFTVSISATNIYSAGLCEALEKGGWQI